MQTVMVVSIQQFQLDVEALCTQNLQKPIEDPDHFLTKTYEGGSYDEQPVKVGFRPDLIWVKNRTSSEH